MTRSVEMSRSAIGFELESRPSAHCRGFRGRLRGQ